MQFQLVEARLQENLIVLTSDRPADLLDVLHSSRLRINGLYFEYVGHELVIDDSQMFFYVEVERKS